MKIIAPGFLPKQEKHPAIGKTARCNKCGCVAEFEEADLLRSDLEQTSERSPNGKTTLRLRCSTEGCDSKIEWQFLHRLRS